MWNPGRPYSLRSGVATDARLSTSWTEVFQISVAFAVITLDIAIFYRFYAALFSGAIPGLNQLYTLLAFAALGAFTGFVAHELAHKVAAQRRGFWAEFRYSPISLVISVVLAFVGLLFAAPGATVISGMRDLDSWGRTSLAGPATNMGEGAILFGLAAWASSSGLATLAGFLGLLAFINFYFGAFNLVPLGPLDGRKIWHWNRGAWCASFAVACAATIGLVLTPYFRWPLLF
jgi:Zn-dependent protease